MVSVQRGDLDRLDAATNGERLTYVKTGVTSIGPRSYHCLAAIINNSGTKLLFLDSVLSETKHGHPVPGKINPPVLRILGK